MDRFALPLTLALLAAPGLGLAAMPEDPPVAAEVAPTPTPMEVLLQNALAEAAEERQARAVVQERLHQLELQQDRREPPAVAIVVPLGFFFSVALVLALILYFRIRMERIRQQTIQLALDKGVELPRELIAPASRPSDLRRGLVLVSGGLGLAAVLAAVAPEEGVWAAGLFPVMIGVGYLVYWGIEGRRLRVEDGA